MLKGQDLFEVARGWQYLEYPPLLVGSANNGGMLRGICFWWSECKGRIKVVGCPAFSSDNAACWALAQGSGRRHQALRFSTWFSQGFQV